MVTAFGVQLRGIMRQQTGFSIDAAFFAIQTVISVSDRIGTEVPRLVDAFHAVVPHVAVDLVFTQVPRVLVQVPVVSDADARH
jgi:hypothetical protein